MSEQQPHWSDPIFKEDAQEMRIMGRITNPAEEFIAIMPADWFDDLGDKPLPNYKDSSQLIYVLVAQAGQVRAITTDQLSKGTILSDIKFIPEVTIDQLKRFLNDHPSLEADAITLGDLPAAA